MSERLTPEQERQVRAHYGGEVQGLAEMLSGPTEPDTQGMSSQQAQKAALDFMAEALHMPIELTVEDLLKGKIVEACYWIRQGSPNRALDILEQAKNL